MYETQKHEMQLETTHPSGAEEWYCPTCGRRILLGVPPNSEMVIMESGDRYANHSGSVGGLQIASVKSNQLDENRLSSWIEAIDGLDFGW